MVVSGSLVRRVLDPRQGRLVREARTALANRHVVPLRRQLAAWRHGFYAETTRLYDFDRYDFDDYISDYARATTLASMNENRYLLDDKVVTYLYLSRVGLPTPTVHGFVRDGRIVWLASEPPAGGLDGLLERRGALVLKSRSGSGGSGFALLRREAGITTVNGRVVDDAASALGRGSLVISDFVVQHDEIAAIYPNSTNTMRVMTFRDVDTDEPFVAFASHRFGTQRSEPVDNFGAGGLSVGIDVETGVLQRAMWRQPGSGPGSREIVWVDDHPDTGSRITGTKIPEWQQVLDVVLRGAAALPGCRYIGWDLAMTEDGVSIIEGNNRGDVLVQMHGPLLLDDRMRKIFAARTR
jgi:Sugar-transfer associated ATP-grasp